VRRPDVGAVRGIAPVRLIIRASSEATIA